MYAGGVAKKDQKQTLDERVIMTRTAKDIAAELLDFVARAGLWVASARAKADDSTATGLLMAPDLGQIEERLRALHLVALVGGGWCANDKCGERLTDPARSASGARHCRECRVGWQLEQRDGVVRAVAVPWPVGTGSA
jgi:hypothetical protein